MNNEIFTLTFLALFLENMFEKFGGKTNELLFAT